jgi:hypothetical protein
VVAVAIHSSIWTVVRGGGDPWEGVDIQDLLSHDVVRMCSCISHSF